jgi:hypothetical protein
MMKKLSGGVWSFFVVFVTGICMTWKNADKKRQKWLEDDLTMHGKKVFFRTNKKFMKLTFLARLFLRPMELK